MPRFIHLKTEATSTLAAELAAKGYPTAEVLSVAECHHMLDNPLEHITAVIIAPEFVHPDMAEIKHRITTMTLHPEATYEDVIREWAAVQPPLSAAIQ